MKEEYLLRIKNAMFWHFTSSEIKETLEDIRMNFESDLDSGMSEEEIIEQYGAPETIVREMMGESDAAGEKRGRAVFLKKIFALGCSISFLLAFIALPSVAASGAVIILSSIFLWFLTGSSCMFGVLPMAEEKERTFWKRQFPFFILFFILQIGLLGGVLYVLCPYLLKGTTQHSLKMYGQGIETILLLMIAVVCVFTILWLKRLFQGNIYMFFAVIQNITVFCGLLLCHDFLHQLDVVLPPERLIPLFTPYFISIPVLCLYWIYVRSSFHNRNAVHSSHL